MLAGLYKDLDKLGDACHVLEDCLVKCQSKLHIDENVWCYGSIIFTNNQRQLLIHSDNDLNQNFDKSL